MTPTSSARAGTVDMLGEFKVSVSASNGEVQVAVAGEVDTFTRGRLRDALDQALDTSPSAIELDLSGVEFLGSEGINALILAWKRAQASGITLRVTRASRIADRVLSLMGLRDTLCTYSCPPSWRERDNPGGLRPSHPAT